MSQKELLQGKYTESYLSKVERGRVQPSEDFLKFVAARLNLPTADLVSKKSVKVKTRPKNSKAVREAQALILTNANVANQTRQYQAAQNFLNKLELDELVTSLKPRYYSIKGEIELGLKNYAEALVDLEQALQLYEANPKTPTFDIALVLNGIGLVYYNQNKPQQAIEKHLRCLEMIEGKKKFDSHFVVKVCTNLGHEYRMLGKSSQALEFYRRAVNWAEEGEDSSALASIYWGMALAYRSLDNSRENLAKCKLYFNKSVETYENLGQLIWAIRARAALAVALIERDELDEAEEILKAALSISESLKDAEALFMVYTNFSYLYSKRENLVEAEQTAQKGVDFAQKGSNFLHSGQALARLGRAKLAVGNDNEAAIASFEAAIKALENTEAYQDLEEVYVDYALALEKLGKLPEALQSYKKLITIRKTSANRANSNARL